MTDLAVEYVALDSILPYVRNATEHTPEHIAEIAASIAEFGWTYVPMVDKAGVLIAGHGRVLAARQLGLTTIPVTRKPLWTDAQVKAYRLLDNQLPKNARQNTELLKLDLQDLQLAGFDMPMLGFGDALEGLLAPTLPGNEGDGDPDGVPTEAPTRCKPGDLWTLGQHRLLCGDATDVLAVERLMAGEKAQTFFTDPPYGDNVGGLRTKSADERVPGKCLVKRVTFIANDGDIEWLEAVFNLVPIFLEVDATKMVFFKWDHYAQIQGMAKSFGKPTALCVWDRVRKASAFFRFQPQHELCLHWGNQADKKEPLALSNVWHVTKEEGSTDLHPTVKPIGILEPALRVTTAPGAIVLDLFLGSGSMIVAAEKTGRRCFGMEIDPKYCDVVLSRWEKFTGKQAVLEPCDVTT